MLPVQRSSAGRRTTLSCRCPGGRMTRAEEPVRAGATPAPDGAVDAPALIRSRRYWLLLVLSATIGVAVPSPSWWWPLPVLAVTGVIVAFAVVYLPGNGGHEPFQGLKT